MIFPAFLQVDISLLRSNGGLPVPQNGTVRHSHIPELQSIRGIAALVVVLAHSSLLFASPALFKFVSEVLLNAHAAVMLFFVLSGYVLSRALSGADLNIESLTTFYVSRLRRIYPALWLAAFAATAYVYLFRRHAAILGASAWYLETTRDAWKFPIRQTLLGQGSSLAPPFWSVWIELQASLALPFISQAVRRKFGLALLLAVTAIGAFFHHAILIYMPSFVLGSLAFQYQRRFGKRLSNPRVLLSSLFVLLFFRLLNKSWQFDSNYHAYFPLLVESFAAACMITGLIHRGSAILRANSLVHLGDISYSLYVLHFTIMSILASFISVTHVSGEWKPPLLMMLTVAFSLPVSALSYKMVELPGIVFGKWLYKNAATSF